ncbi:unnamed protein product [Kuraishia capsulata CBS 1993]|uniref:Metal-dependent protein hydrolase n=1 Tax=Kuraishia capsulata CBS 1993 TaxID=1382522 RepID=W6MIC3_9ASCO|nr:uncharacterized protein KUCA_T00001603001 [Kuraishia capsulata CBS 1993]CDK25633.1 unnamed protein product [Kuraishia capsulata CBS 1993]
MVEEEERVAKKPKMSTEQKHLQICTHSGQFHADESLAVYMLKTLPKFKDATVVRSRDPKVWEESDIVVDVGGISDEVKFFDHHQRDFEGTFSSKYSSKLSSAGLIYKHFGKEIISVNLELNAEKDSESIDLLYEKIYKEFIEAIDANDNGISAYGKDAKPLFSEKNFKLASVVQHLNPSWINDPKDADYDAAFAKASEFMGMFFTNVLNDYGKAWLPARQYVEKAVAESTSIDPQGRILVLDRFVPWQDHLFTIERETKKKVALYVLFEDTSGNWRISAVPAAAGSFDSRKKLPEPWRGVRDDALSKLTNVEGCVFVHAAGFIGGAKTKDAVLQLAKMAVDY